MSKAGGFAACFAMDMSLEELENRNPWILQEKSFQFCFKKLN